VAWKTAEWVNFVRTVLTNASVGTSPLMVITLLGGVNGVMEITHQYSRGDERSARLVGGDPGP